MTLDMERARGLVARCWCDPRTSGTKMDPALAEVFAERLVKLVNSAETLYMAGRWVLEDERIQTTDQKQAELWDDLCSALGLAPNEESLMSIVDTAKIVSGETVSITRHGWSN